jgi:hypothetical protein
MTSVELSFICLYCLLLKLMLFHCEPKALVSITKGNLIDC